MMKGMLELKLYSQAIKDGVDTLNMRQNDHERQAILNWLTPIDYFTEQNDFIGRRQNGAGKWLLDSTEFRGWLKDNNQTLFCPGIPGAGKTIMTAVVIQHLSMRFNLDPSIGIAYVYCNYRRHEEQSPTNLLAALLKQLLHEQQSLPGNITDLYHHHKRNQTLPQLEEIASALHSVVAAYSRTFVVIDALDECNASDGSRMEFLRYVFNLQASLGINLFVTSRFIPEIVKEFEGTLSLEVRASDEDVHRYVASQFPRLPSFVSRNVELQDEIKSAIVEAIKGMYVAIHIECAICMVTKLISTQVSSRTAPTRIPHWEEVT
jgi:hypothetical protein